MGAPANDALKEYEELDELAQKEEDAAEAGSPPDADPTVVDAVAEAEETISATVMEEEIKLACK